MNIDIIRPVDNVANQYIVRVDGVEMVVATRPGQSPDEVVRTMFQETAPTYAEQRLQEYPPLADQLDMIYHDIAAWREQIAAIKARHPKA